MSFSSYSAIRNVLKRKKILITLGSTREYLDPVRFISNGSSGKMGIALAETLKLFGAEIFLICGPSMHPPKNFSSCPVVSARDMLKEVKKKFLKSDVFISVAAVSDYRPEYFSPQKIKKDKNFITLPLVKNPDILASVSKNKTGQFCVGFALENRHALKNAFKKMKDKNCDLMILNDPDSMESDFIRAKILFADGEIWDLGRVSKKKCSVKISQAIAQSILCGKNKNCFSH